MRKLAILGLAAAGCMPTIAIPWSGWGGEGTFGDEGGTFDPIDTSSDTSASATGGDESGALEASSSTSGVSSDEGVVSEGGGPGSSDGGPPPDPLPGGIDWKALEVADFDGDGDGDLLVLGTDPGQVLESAVGLGHGDGTFDAMIDLDLEGNSVYPAVGRLDADARVDVVLDLIGPNVAVWRSFAPDDFTHWPDKYVGGATLNTEIVDVDLDDDGDILTLWAEGYTYGLSVAHVPVGGTDVDVVGLIADDFVPAFMRAGDLDGDARVDVVVFTADGGASAVLFGAPDNDFSDPVAIATPVPVWGAKLIDFDGDGALDVCMTSMQAGAFAVLPGDGAGGFAAAAVHDLGGFAPYSFDVGDVDGDGAMDFVTTGDTEATVAIWHGDGLGGLAAEPVEHALQSVAVRVIAADLDEDAVSDLALATFAAGEVTVMLGPL